MAQNRVKVEVLVEEVDPIKDEGMFEDRETEQKLKDEKEMPEKRLKREPLKHEESTSVFAEVWVKAEMEEDDQNDADDVDDADDPDYTVAVPEVKQEKPKKEKLKKTRKRPSTILSCTQCDFTTVHKNSLKLHTLTHSSEKPCRCTHCEYSTVTNSSLLRHFKSKHKDVAIESGMTVETYPCDECNYTTTNKYLLNNHKRKHAVDKRFKCKFCSFETSYSNAFVKHSRTHEDKTMYRCSKCPYETTFEGRLDRHLEKIHNELQTKARFICEFCGTTYKQRWRLTIHQKKSKRYGIIHCPYCEFQSNFKCQVQKHKKTHDTLIEYKNRSATNALFDASSFLELNNTNHVEHTESNTHNTATIGVPVERFNEGEMMKCDKCPFNTLEYNDMIKHLENEHFMCGQCGYAFKDKFILKTHQQNAKKDTILKCSYCDFVSYYKCVITKHTTNHFTGIIALSKGILDYKQDPMASELIGGSSENVTEKETIAHNFETYNQTAALNAELERFDEAPQGDRGRGHRGPNRRKGQSKFGSYHVISDCIQWNKIKILETKGSVRRFQCHLCEYSSKFKASVQKHFQRHHTGGNHNRPYKCCNCSFTTKTQEQIALHNKRSSSDKQLTCPICQFTTSFKCSYTEHQRNHYANECHFCQYRYKHKHELIRHVAVVHLGKGQKCKFCDYIAKTKESLLCHEAIHTGRKPFKCNLCTYSSVRRSLLHAHFRRYHNMIYNKERSQATSIDPNNIESLKAPLAQTNYQKDTDIKEVDKFGHFSQTVTQKDAYTNEDETSSDIQTVEFDPIDSNVEDSCKAEDNAEIVDVTGNSSEKEYEAENPEDLESDPIENLEKSDGVYNKMGKNRFGKYLINTNCVDWQSIQVLMNNDSERPFQCYSCDFTSKFRWSVQKHFQRHHSDANNKPYKCINCNFTTKTKDAISHHNKKNMTKKKITCEDCEFTTEFKCTYNEHRRVHNEFRCSQCNVSYKTKYVLDQHIMFAHLGVGIRCRFCKYTASRRELMVYHEATHTGKKPFNCRLCDYSAFRKTLLQNHLKKSHNEDYTPNTVLIKKIKIQKRKMKKKRVKVFLVDDVETVDEEEKKSEDTQAVNESDFHIDEEMVKVEISD